MLDKIKKAMIAMPSWGLALLVLALLALAVLLICLGWQFVAAPILMGIGGLLTWLAGGRYKEKEDSLPPRAETRIRDHEEAEIKKTMEAYWKLNEASHEADKHDEEAIEKSSDARLLEGMDDDADAIL